MVSSLVVAPIVKLWCLSGTILLLFLLYINDLPNCPCQIASLGCTLMTPILPYTGNNIHNIQTSLNKDLENVHYWLRANKLTLNMTKTEFMLIGSRQRLSTVTNSQHLQLMIFELPKSVCLSLALSIYLSVYLSI